MNKKGQHMGPATAFRWISVVVGGIGAIVLIMSLLTSPINWTGALIGAGLIFTGIAIYKSLTR